MTVETATYISSLNASYPAASDQRREGDDHMRLIKSTVKATFPNISGAVTPTHTELNYVAGVTSAIQTQLNAKVGTTDTLLKGQPRLLLSTAASSSTTVEFKNGTGGVVLDSTYDIYQGRIIRASAGTGATSIYMRTSSSTGAAYDQGVADYRRDYSQVRSGATTTAGATAAQIDLCGAQTLATTSWFDAVITIYQPSATDRCAILWEAIFYDNSSVLTQVRGGAMRDTASKVDAIQFLMSSGNIASGTFNLYGIVK